MGSPNLSRIQVLNDESLHQVRFGLDSNGTLSNASAVDGVAVAGSWDVDTGQLRFTLPFERGIRRYLGYYMEFSSDASPVLAGIARETYDDGSQGDPFGWYAAEDVPRLRLGSPDQDQPSHSLGGVWRIVDRGAIGTLFIRTAEDGTFSPDSALNAAPISGTWDRSLSGLSFVQSIGDPRDGVLNSYDGYLARTGADGSFTLAGIVSYQGRRQIQAAGWFAVRG